MILTWLLIQNVLWHFLCEQKFVVFLEEQKMYSLMAGKNASSYQLWGRRVSSNLLHTLHRNELQNKQYLEGL